MKARASSMRVDGTERAGWPVDVVASVRSGNIAFNPQIQSQRASPTIVNGTLYIDGDSSIDLTSKGYLGGFGLTIGAVFGELAGREAGTNARP